MANISHYCGTLIIAVYKPSVADLGFPEGGLCYTLAREVLEAMPLPF